MRARIAGERARVCVVETAFDFIPRWEVEKIGADLELATKSSFRLRTISRQKVQAKITILNWRSPACRESTLFIQVNGGDIRYIISRVIRMGNSLRTIDPRVALKVAKYSFIKENIVEE